MNTKEEETKSMSDEKINAVGKNIQEKSTVIWNAANTLYGNYKPHEYGLVIIPMTVIKRLHDCLLPTHEAVLKEYEDKKHLAVISPFLCRASGYQFYNTSKFTFETLVADPDNIEENFHAYLNGFSDNVKDILVRMEFDKQIDKMAEAGSLYQIITDFNSEKADMSPEKITATDMGYIFENLVYRFSESYGEEAGAHFTSRDIVYLMCDLLVTHDRDTIAEDGTKTVYDMTMGTSQMLTCMEERLKELNSNTQVIVFGQEFNPFTFGIAKADMLIRGGNPDNMQFGNTLSDDKFKGYKFDYIISNPPFGIDWKKEKPSVEAESKDINGRFGVGLPSVSDGQQLFTLNGVAKLKDTGCMAIIQNGSPLFNGDAGSGPSCIRQYLLEQDWLEAIIQLPKDLFYNTGIATYIWIISKDRPSSHNGRTLLIDASNCYEPRRKNIGNKRVDITNKCRELIVQAYGNFRSKDYRATLASGKEIIVKARLFDTTDFGYNKITIESPLLDEKGNFVLKKGKKQPDPSKRDTENVPLDEDIDSYFAREVKPYKPDAWVDHSKTKVGYEIPFTRTFYEFKPLEDSDTIAKRIQEHEAILSEKLKALFGDKN